MTKATANTNGLSGQTIVVLGAASGMGLATARLARQRGARVVMMDINRDRLERVASEVGAEQALQVDVSDPRSVAQGFGHIERVDHVYNAAGSTQLGSILDGDDRALERQLDPIKLRLFGSVYVVRSAAPKIRSGGSFVFTGGISSDRPVPGAWVSSVGTMAAEQLARSMALELAPIRANAVSPGWTDTPMWDPILGANKAEVFESVSSKLPVRRLSSAEEVAEAVLFLMNSEAITGEVLHIDGGGRLV